MIDALSAESLKLLRAIADSGSMAAAARGLNLVPSAMSYRVRQLETSLDVLLVDRSAKNAKLTMAGTELLREGERVLLELEAIAQRVKRVATGWEPQFTIAVDGIVNKAVVMELVERFLALQVPTRLRLREEALFGTWEALLEARADLAMGVVVDQPATSIRVKPLGEVDFVFAVAPHHPLAKFQGVLTDQEIRKHRIVAAADSTQHNKSVSIGILPGQDVLTLPNLQSKLDAQLRGLGCGFLPECMARVYLESGRLIAVPTERATRVSKVSYAWHQPQQLQSKALQWWLSALQPTHVRRALLHG